MSEHGDRITITGNVATEPEYKRTGNGVPITSFRVARDLRRYDRAAGAWVDAGTNWYSVSVFRALADHAFGSLNKGDRVILTGVLRLRDWDNGTRRGTAIEIDADAIGHDLRWGTTTFTKDAQSASPGDRRPSSVAPDDGAWAAPGLALDEADAAGGAQELTDAAPLSTGEGDRPVLALVTEETPF